jgi:hypothetical protein
MPTSKLGAIYPAIIELCRSGITAANLQAHLEGTGHHVHVSYVRKVLRDWTDAGALRAVGSHKLVYYATARAMEPSIIAAAIGPGAAALHGVDVAPEPPQGSLRSQALEAVQLPHHTIHAAPQVAQVPPGPLSLFRAEFTTQGLVIPYEEVPGLIAMLDAVMTDRGR